MIVICVKKPIGIIGRGGANAKGNGRFEGRARLDSAETDARALADEQLRIAPGEFGTLTAQSVDGKAAAIHTAAARIEMAATMLP